MAATYTFDVFSTLDGFGSPGVAVIGAATGASRVMNCSITALPHSRRSSGWSSAVPTYRLFAHFLALIAENPEAADTWITRMLSMPATVVSNTLERPLGFPDATIASGDAVDVVARLKEESAVPLRSHGSLSLNRAVMAAGLVDRVQVTLFPVITGQTGGSPIFPGAGDFDLELIDTRTLDGNTQELIYRPTLHV